MADLSFSMRIGVEDGTEAGLQSAMSRFKKFMGGLAGKAFTLPFNIGKAGLGLLRDVNMGLLPLIRGIDNVIDRGSKLEVIRRGFLNLTGASSKNADIMAKQIVRASSGTMRMAEAMALANRALGSMSFDDLLTAVEFISKKSVATGKDPGEALGTVITGLVRGSTLFLDDFGILVDGADGVKRSFDAIKGSGAFDQLGPAAQKAETIRQALAEMRQQTDKLGVSGRETFFQWSGIKNLIGDGVDKLVLAVAKSKALKDGMVGFASILRGITSHFEKGGGFGELLLGKGKSGGLLGIAGSAVLDLGEALGRGILGGLLKGLSLIPELLMAAWNGLTAALDVAINKIPGKIIEAFQWLKNDFLPALKMTALEIYDDIIARNASRFSSWMVGEDGQPTTFGKLMGIRGAGQGNANFKEGFEQLVDPENISDTPPFVPVAPGEKAGNKFDDALDMYNKLDRERAKDSLQSRASQVPGTIFGTALKLLVSNTMAIADVQKSLWQLLSDSSSTILMGGVLSGDARIQQSVTAFFDEFSEAESKAKVKKVSKPGDMEFTDAKRAQLRRDERKLEEEKKAVMRGDRGVRREALQRAAEEERELRKEGYRITPSDRRRIFNRHLRDVKRERIEPIEKEAEEIRRKLEEDRINRLNRNRVRRALNGQNDVDPQGAANAVGHVEVVVTSPKQEDLLALLVQIGSSLLAALGMGEAAIAGVGGRKS